jgi:hypothetical protein
MHWIKPSLYGAASIARVSGVYEVQDILRAPDGKYKIKVLQYDDNQFVAIPNLWVRSAGPTSGSGSTEQEALENALRALAVDLDSLEGRLQREDFEWADPTEF